jgi:hypothetical protein
VAGYFEGVFQCSIRSEAVEADNLSRAAEGDKTDAMNLASLEADGGSGGDVEAPTEGKPAVESQRAISFEKVEVRANLNGAVAGVGDLKFDRVSPGVDDDVALTKED